MPNLPKTSYFELSPEWLCEVLSPSTLKVDRIRKMPIYQRHRVQYAWLIDPIERTLEAYRNTGQGWLAIGSWHDSALVAIEPFDAVPFELGELWE